MNYKEALNQVLANKEYTMDNMLLYGKLLDLIKGPIMERHYAFILLRVNKGNYLYHSLKEKGLINTRKELLSNYNSYKSICTLNDYKTAINAYCEIIVPEEYKRYLPKDETQKEENKPEVKKPKKTKPEANNTPKANKTASSFNQDIDNIYISGNYKKIYLSIGDNNEVKVINNYVSKKIKLSSLMYKDTLRIARKADELHITLKEKVYGRIRIEVGSRCNIFVSDAYSKSICAKEVFIDSVSGSVTTNTEATTVTIDTVESTIQAFGKVDSIDIQSIKGDVMTTLESVSIMSCKAKIRCTEGNINIYTHTRMLFLDRLFASKNVYKGTIPQMQIDAETIHGKIKFIHY